MRFLDDCLQKLKNNPDYGTLELRHDTISDEDATALAVGLSSNTSVTILQILSCKISDYGIQIITTALGLNKKIAELDFSRNNVSYEGIKTLVGLLTIIPSITVLRIWSNLTDGSSNAGALLIGENLANNKNLLCLDLSWGAISDEGIKVIANSLTLNKTLTELDLRNCEISDKGAEYLAAALEANTTLKTLYLQGNNISINGAKDIARAICIRDVKFTINLFENNFDYFRVWPRLLEKYEEEMASTKDALNVKTSDDSARHADSKKLKISS